jgi:hypothetical protein
MANQAAQRVLTRLNQLKDVQKFLSPDDIGKIPTWDGDKFIPLLPGGIDLSGKANLSGAAFTGGISAPSILVGVGGLDLDGNGITGLFSLAFNTDAQIQLSDPNGVFSILDGASAARFSVNNEDQSIGLGYDTTITGDLHVTGTIPASQLTGLLPSAVIPPLAITQPFPVANQAAMLALVAQRGDVAIRADNGKSYILSTDNPGTLADWLELTGAGAVSAWNGLSGNIVATTTNLPEGTNLYFTNNRVATFIIALNLVHLQPGVTGTGTTLDPYVGWEAFVNGLALGQTAVFVDGIFQAAAELWVKFSGITLQGSGSTIIRSTQAANATQSVTGITWEVSPLGNRAVVAKNAHGYTSGDQVLILNADQTAYNRCATIYDVTANSFKYYLDDDAPASPATGVITMRKARMILKFGKIYQATPSPDFIWRPRISGIIFDGQNNIEMAAYLRNWEDGSLDRVKFRNFKEYFFKASEVVGGRFAQFGGAYRADLVDVSTSATRNHFRIGERDPNPAFPADIGTPAGSLIFNADNLTIQDMFSYGATETALDLPYGFNVQVLNGNAGLCTTSIKLGADTRQFVVDGTDLEDGGKLIIDGSKHTIRGVNLPGCLVTINGVGNTVIGAGKGNHVFRDIDALNVTNNCDAYTEISNSQITAIGGTHLERIVSRIDGGLQRLVKGAANERLNGTSLTGAPVGRSNVNVGFREGHWFTLDDASYLVDANFVVDPADAAAIRAAAGLKISLLNVNVAGTFTAGNATITGTGTRGVAAQSTNGGIAYLSCWGFGVAAGFMATSPSANKAYFGFGADFTNEAAVIANSAGYYDASNNVFLYHDLNVAQALNLTGDLKHAGNKIDKVVALTDGATTTFDLALGDMGTWTIGGNRIFAVSNGHSGSFVVKITQDGTGSRIPTWPASFKFSGGSTLSTAAGAVDILAFLSFDGGTTYQATLTTGHA